MIRRQVKHTKRSNYRFIMNMFDDFCVCWSEEALKKQKLEQKRTQSLGVDWDEEHNYCLYWQELSSAKLFKRKFNLG